MFPHPSMSPDPCWKNMSLFPKARSTNIIYIYVYIYIDCYSFGCKHKTSAQSLLCMVVIFYSFFYFFCLFSSGAADCIFSVAYHVNVPTSINVPRSLLEKHEFVPKSKKYEYYIYIYICIYTLTYTLKVQRLQITPLSLKILTCTWLIVFIIFILHRINI